jgi:hypothetical protein
LIFLIISVIYCSGTGGLGSLFPIIFIIISAMMQEKTKTPRVLRDFQAISEEKNPQMERMASRVKIITELVRVMTTHFFIASYIIFVSKLFIKFFCFGF